MLDDILALPGNKPVFEELKKLLTEHKAVAFVGAGASAGMYPLWGKFIELLADHAVAQGKAEQKDAARWKADTTSTPQQRVNIIVRRLGESLYRNFLRATFGPRKGSDGKRCTPTHSAILRLPVRAFVTTNYDPGLDFARSEVRPGCLSTGTPTWEDDDEVYRWRTGDVLNDDCPILWAHGYWQRPGGIVLNAGEYYHAYKPSLYRETFKELWIRERLLFVGFGFSDPQFTFMVGEFLRDLTAANAPARHITILGRMMPADASAADDEEIKERRESLEADYHVRALFYPVINRREGDEVWEDHSALARLLDALADTARTFICPQSPPITSAPVSTLPASAAAIHAKWVHETTDDAKFIGRDEEITWLNRLMRDQNVRVLAICAAGGTGKTALVGHWLKRTLGWRVRPFTGLFAWSFYQDRDTAKFLRSVLDWGHEVFGVAQPNDTIDLVDGAIAFLHGHSIVVVLDGLEVLQEGPDEARHGSFLDGDLREFLHALCQLESCQSIAVLTSRFVFADLERHLGTAFHQLELPGLGTREGAALLAQLGVRGPATDREEISERLDGHPLGLRVFGGALPDSERDNPRAFLDHALHDGGLPRGASLSDKVLRLLDFYEKQLPAEQARLLSIVSLFRSPVAQDMILRLARGLFTGDVPLSDDTAVIAALRKLYNDHVLTLEPIEGGQGYAAHPILRDHFRGILLRGNADMARRAADLLKGQPSQQQVQNVKEIEPILIAIELLLDAGEFETADELFRERLENGRLFLSFPAAPEGLACALGFVLNEHRRKQVHEKLSWGRLGFYLNEVGLWASLSGYYEFALSYYSDASTIDREHGDGSNLSTALQNEAELLQFLGRVNESFRSADEAVRLALGAADEPVLRNAFARRGWAALVAGRLTSAAEDFARANLLEVKNDPEGDELYSNRGLNWAQLLLYSGHLEVAVRRTEANLRICQRFNWHGSVASCHAMLAACALAEGKFDDAEAELRMAEPVLRRGQILYELARLKIIAGEVALARKDAQGALHEAAEALALAAPRSMRLVHADALILRGKARAVANERMRACDDAREGLRLARDCSYPWAERAALQLLANCGDAVLDSDVGDGDSAHATRRQAESSGPRSEANAIGARLVLTKEDLAAADEKAKAWLDTWEKKQS